MFLIRFFFVFHLELQLELDAASGTLTVLDDTLENSEPQKSQGSRSERNLDF